MEYIYVLINILGHRTLHDLIRNSSAMGTFGIYLWDMFSSEAHQEIQVQTI